MQEERPTRVWLLSAAIALVTHSIYVFQNWRNKIHFESCLVNTSDITESSTGSCITTVKHNQGLECISFYFRNLPCRWCLHFFFNFRKFKKSYVNESFQ